MPSQAAGVYDPFGRYMKSITSHLGVIIVFLAATTTIYVLQKIEAPREYPSSIRNKRRQIEAFMKSSPSSPFTEEGKASFRGLYYFPPDPEYQVKARVLPIQDEEIVELPASDGTVQSYIRYAWAEFTLLGSRHRLLLLKARDDRVGNRLFLAFRDATSGEQTYSGGRYVDLYQQREGEIVIDFNLAYRSR